MKKHLSNDLVRDIRKHLEEDGFGRHWNRGELHDWLINYRYDDRRYLINQLEPIFNYLSMMGELWPED